MGAVPVSVREGLLALLSDRPVHGYVLKTGFEAATAGVWPLNVGQVYKTLERLERDGLVDTDELDGQRRYRITDDGVAELGAWWEAEPEDDPPPRDELMLKVLMAVGHGREQALDVINRQRHAVMTLLQMHRRAPKRSTGRGADPVVAAMVDDALVVRAEADLRWLDLCEERLTHDSHDDRPASPVQPRKRGRR
jgi:DNA-binding PadR family transcriptional regulator